MRLDPRRDNLGTGMVKSKKHQPGGRLWRGYAILKRCVLCWLLKLVIVCCDRTICVGICSILMGQQLQKPSYQCVAWVK